MTSFEIYVFILCAIVFILLTVLFTYMITQITKMQLKLIRLGQEDEKIKTEYQKRKKPNLALKWISNIASGLVCLVFGAAFAFSMYMQATQFRPVNGAASLKVVKSESMADKCADNVYLFEHKLNDQIQMFDLILCRQMPPEEELELYDIVVYQREDVYVIHRIVGIEEPNAEHPNERHFLLQGDAVERPDTFPVLYGQMQGIYDGTRIPFVGSFVMFLQSPAGWLCILLVIFSMIATPIVEKKLKEAMDERISALGLAVSEHVGA